MNLDRMGIRVMNYLTLGLTSVALIIYGLANVQG